MSSNVEQDRSVILGSRNCSKEMQAPAHQAKSHLVELDIHGCGENIRILQEKGSDAIRNVYEEFKVKIKNNILYNKQFGFKSGHSTDHAILHLVHDIFNGLNEKKYTLGIFIDLSKVFDTVDHIILLSKLEIYGIRNSNMAWFKSYLYNRKQYISYEGGKTDNMTNG
ncbi:uncharacterized protein LOC136082650 [Hydra vulgaris]|uniref:Uncharacterized protein LOC136082650 n=1 Tax=Hydra vulgaris TaxID=6087 RepID=A0ABM4C927_HYDVU